MSSSTRTAIDAAMIETFDPRTNSLHAVVPDHDADTVRQAVARARSVSRSWASVSFSERQAHLLEVRNRLLDRGEELVEVICAETGKQRAEAVTSELMAVCETIDWYARHGERILAPQRARSPRCYWSSAARTR